MKKSVPVGRYFGIKVYLHYTWFFIFALLSWGLAKDWFPQKFAGHSPEEYWILGILSAAFLFVSILMHELSHSLVAKHYKMKVANITLFFFGGVASLHEGNIKPKQEFNIAIAGPLLSLALAGAFFLVGKATDWFFIEAIADYLVRLNLIIAVFNMVPGFPLDGGRVFRALAWMITKDFAKATRMATFGGKIVAYTLVFLGMMSIFSGNWGGLWMILLGGFLLLMTTASYEQAMIKEQLRGKKAKNFVVKGSASDKYRVKANTQAYNVLNSMLKKKVNEAAVYEKKKFLGIVKRNDIVEYMRKKNVEEVVKEKQLLEVEE